MSAENDVKQELWQGECRSVSTLFNCFDHHLFHSIHVVKQKFNLKKKRLKLQKPSPSFTRWFFKSERRETSFLLTSPRPGSPIFQIVIFIKIFYYSFVESTWALVIYPKNSLIAKIPIFISKSGSIGKCVKNRVKYFLQKIFANISGPTSVIKKFRKFESSL